jgi:hypothetical protein
MARNSLYLTLAATVVAAGLAGSASASTVGGGPIASDFKLVETGDGLNGVYSVTDNSSEWYITGFAVTNSHAGGPFEYADTGQNNWLAGKFCNGSACGNGLTGVAESSDLGQNLVYGFFYENLAVDGSPDSSLATLLATSIAPHTVNDNNFEFFFAPPESTVQFNLVNGDGDTATLVFPASSGTPEPASWALMIGGFGLAGAALRRRRAVAA